MTNKLIGRSIVSSTGRKNRLRNFNELLISFFIFLFKKNKIIIQHKQSKKIYVTFIKKKKSQ